MLAIVVLSLFGAVLGFPADFEEAIPVAEPEPGVNWAVLIAGSTGWGNYRHQADVCHAYQILHRNGIPDERIVVMMADDLAHNIRNPTKGVIINHPDGPDVYHGVPKDYTRFDVTAKNFLRVLKGDREGVAGIGSGKVIESGPHDNVFVYYTDHGAPGIVAMPHGGMLHADDLVTTLKEMHQEGKFNKLVFYLESCESGSMFDKILPDNINIFATTAANGKESSYACYMDTKRKTYLGDLYSVNWMEDSDVEQVSKETLEQQFEKVKMLTNRSHVQEYGDMNMKNDIIGLYQSTINYPSAPLKPYRKVPHDAVPSPDVPLAILNLRLETAESEEERQAVLAELKEELNLRTSIAQTMKDIVTMATDDADKAADILVNHHRDITARPCYKAAVNYFHDKCYDLSQYEHALRHMYTLVNLCEEQVPLDRVTAAMDSIC
ncbi:legumain-like [Branchiostoma floridae x Branchiostoma belcheri]